MSLQIMRAIAIFVALALFDFQQKIKRKLLIRPEILSRELFHDDNLPVPRPSTYILPCEDQTDYESCSLFEDSSHDSLEDIFFVQINVELLPFRLKEKSSEERRL